MMYNKAKIVLLKLEEQNCKKTRSLINSDHTMNDIPNRVLHQGQQDQNKTNEDIIRNVL